jgi:hypothetical protein
MGEIQPEVELELVVLRLIIPVETFENFGWLEGLYVPTDLVDGSLG